jgi:thiamine-monophosphate kinase
MSRADAAEAGLIATLLGARPAPHGVTVDAGDDAAVLDDGTVMTVDAMVEGVHFRADADPADVGYKLVAVSVSDIAAMGAAPTAAVLSMSLPSRPAPEPWCAAFACGVGEACRAFGVSLVGGDTTGAMAERVVSLTLLGRCVAEPWRRSGARVGDLVVITGEVGEAGAGWMLDDPWPEARAALARPRPPLAFSVDAARLGGVHAAMDLSDGLAIDLPRLCDASGVGAEIDPRVLPSSAAVLAHPDRLVLQTCGGEDYQLLMAVDPAAENALTALAAQHGLRFTIVGRFGGMGARLLGVEWPDRSYRHFADHPTDGAPPHRAC